MPVPDSVRQGSSAGPMLVLAAIRGLVLALIVYAIALGAARDIAWLLDHPVAVLSLGLVGWAGSLVPELVRHAGSPGWSMLRWAGVNLLALFVALASSMPALAILDEAVRRS